MRGFRQVLVAVVVAVSLGLSGCSAANTPPEYTFLDGAAKTAPTPFQFPCLSLTEDDLESILRPSEYVLTGVQQIAHTASGRESAGECDVRLSQIWILNLSLGPSPLGGSASANILPLWGDWVDGCGWSDDLVYRFPDSYGSGGVLWLAPGENGCSILTPVDPSVAAKAQVWGELCANDYCLMVKVDYPPSLKLNVNGVVDPVGTAVFLLQTVWQRVAVGRPDLGLPDVPSVNPSPYVPIASPVVYAPSPPPPSSSTSATASESPT